ncbi:hypothetical protein LBF07_21630 [Enterobacter cloacae complex sp. ECL352]|nr:hypothetical protein LBF07_21630 [Enterobacter cloacae complex sp. ECL352]
MPPELVAPFEGHFALMRNPHLPLLTQRCRSSSCFFASDNSFVYLASSTATSRWRTCISLMVALAVLRFLAALSRWSL